MALLKPHGTTPVFPDRDDRRANGAAWCAADVEKVRADFPILRERLHGKRLAYLDSAASSQRPDSVLDAMDRYYRTTHANVHRGVYALAEEATRLYEAARARLGRFIGAPDPAREVVFTRNATEALNLVAQSWGRANLATGDVVVLTEMEHHANLVPWLMLAAERELELRYLRIEPDGCLALDGLDTTLDGARLVCVTLASNVLGTINPVADIAAVAHDHGAFVVADGAQFVPHLPTDVAALGCDFLALTAHKMLGPTGIGALWARRALLEAMPPFLGGGEMIRDVRLDGFEPNELPWKFEAGTPPIAEAVGLGAAIAYLDGLGLSAIRRHEMALLDEARHVLEGRFGGSIEIYGPVNPAERTGVLSFRFGDVHPHDVAQVLDEQGVCVRAGHHCAKPLMRNLGVAATTRASFYCYNGSDDIEQLADGLDAVRALFG